MIERDTRTPMFTTALLTIARTRQRPKRLLQDEWIKAVVLSTTLRSHDATVIQTSTGTQSLLHRVKSETEKQVSYINAYILNLERWY